MTRSLRAFGAQGWIVRLGLLLRLPEADGASGSLGGIWANGLGEGEYFVFLLFHGKRHGANVGLDAETLIKPRFCFPHFVFLGLWKMWKTSFFGRFLWKRSKGFRPSWQDLPSPKAKKRTMAFPFSQEV